MARQRRRRRTTPVQANAQPGRKRWRILIALVVFVGGGIAVFRLGALKSARPGARDRLNVLLITADTTRADYLGCYGATAATPNMDRLAREGTLFRRCSTAVVLTTPSHASIMTGLYPFVHGVRRNGEGHLPAAATTLAEVFKAAGYATGASVGSCVLDPRHGLAQGFDTYAIVPAKAPGSGNWAQRKGNEVCDDALEFLRKHSGQPFFLWAHFYDPHHPYVSQTHPNPDSVEAYADEITFMDTQIGRLLDALRDLKLEQRTLVVLVGDHGEGLGEHGEAQHGYFVYETCEHVPFIVRCPGVIPAGQQIPAVVRTVDIAPTLLDRAALPPLPEASGVSLASLLDGKTTDLQLAAYSETLEPCTLLRLSRIRTFTAGKWKYVLSAEPRLYNLDADPHEQRNVIAEHPDMAASLREQLRTLIAEAPPRLPADSAPRLTGAEVQRLESLGYVAPVGEGENVLGPELDTFDPHEPDPHRHAEIIHKYARFLDVAPAQAEALLKSVLAALPNAPVPQRDLAQVLQRLGKLDEAGSLYEQYLSSNGSDTRARGEYMGMLMGQKRWEAAVAQGTEILRVDSDDCTTHGLLGRAYERLGQLDKACEHLEAALRIQPQYTASQVLLGQVFLKRQRYMEAADCFRRALALHADNSEAKVGLRQAMNALQKGGGG